MGIYKTEDINKSQYKLLVFVERSYV